MRNPLLEARQQTLESVAVPSSSSTHHQMRPPFRTTAEQQPVESRGAASFRVKGGGMMRSMKTHIRPDGRHFVWDPDAGSVAEAKADLYCTVESTEVDPYLALGFEVNRREGMYLLPIRAVRIGPLQGVDFAQADEVDEATLRLLDDELRQDVPGTNGWQWPEAGFREETFEAAEFDPTTYLVAVDSATREYIGIVRVWMKEPTPRLGFIGGASALPTPRYRARAARGGLLPSRGTWCF